MLQSNITEPSISAEQAAQQGKQWAEVHALGCNLAWLEFDASQGRISLLLKQGDAVPVNLTPPDYSVRSRVYEYGGGSFCLTQTGVVFVNESDQGLYWQSVEQPDRVLLVRQADGFRYGDLLCDPQRNRLIAVEEQHSVNRVDHRLVAISLGNPKAGQAAGRRQVLVEGADFYSSPRLNRDGSLLAWLSWDHPQQPWRSTHLWQARLNPSGIPDCFQQLTNGQHCGQEEAIVQPEYGANDALYYLSDRNGWWNLYRYLEGSDGTNPSATAKQSKGGHTEALFPRDAEFCRAPWQLGQRAYVLLDDDTIGCSWWRDGKAELGLLDLPSRQLTPTGEWAAAHSLAAWQGRLCAVVESPVRPGALLQWDSHSEKMEPLAQLQFETGHDFDRHVFKARHIAIELTDGVTVNGLLYRPSVAVGQAATALIIQLHGGPTAQADARFDPLKQFWLQRGFVLLDLNYRGSSGYGRAYRHSLQGRWGQSDVDDVLAAARHCIQQGWADPRKIVVRGNSAGGYTVLQLLSQADADSPIRTGASLYGISDLERLAQQTHKFESQYLSWLIGDPKQHRRRYRQRSPIHRAKSFSRPLIFFQGGLDRVVPATQTFTLYNQLKGRGLAVEYQAFANERHGFRYAASRAKVLQREWAFYRAQLDLEQGESELLEEAVDVQRTG
ncbi:MAG: prolyl oligopeptidase family serine peptidase [Halopseudomonas sp.]